MAPFREERDTRIAREQQEAFHKQVSAQTDTIMGRIDKVLEGRKDLIRYVDALMDAHPRMDPYDAAWQIRDQYIKPGQTRVAETTVAETMRRKAAATTANGAGTVASPITRPKTEKELAAFLENLDRRQ